MEIGIKLNQLRKLSGMTQEQFAEKLNVSRQTISKWETGNTSPDLESIVRVCKIFHVSLDDLFPRATSQVAACRYLATAARVKCLVACSEVFD